MRKLSDRSTETTDASSLASLGKENYAGTSEISGVLRIPTFPDTQS
jgi:hypothetical protein